MTQPYPDKDYYALLGVAQDADIGTIRTAYRRLARESHPDANPGNAQAEARFKDVSEAWEVLSAPARRKEYDEARAPFTGDAPRAPRDASRKPRGGRRRGRARPDESDLFAFADNLGVFDDLTNSDAPAGGRGTTGRSGTSSRADAGGQRPPDAGGHRRADAGEPGPADGDDAHAPKPTIEELFADLDRAAANSAGQGGTAELGAAITAVSHLGKALESLGRAERDPRLGFFAQSLGRDCVATFPYFFSVETPSGLRETFRPGRALHDAIEGSAWDASPQRRRELIAHTLDALSPLFRTVARLTPESEQLVQFRESQADRLRALLADAGVGRGAAAPEPDRSRPAHEDAEPMTYAGRQNASRLRANQREEQRSAPPPGTGRPGPSTPPGRSGSGR